MRYTWRRRLAGCLAGMMALGTARPLTAQEPVPAPAPAAPLAAPVPPPPAVVVPAPPSAVVVPALPSTAPVEASAFPTGWRYQAWGDLDFYRPPPLRLRGETLVWWVRGMPAPPLVTTGPVTTLGPGARPGTLGLPGTQTLLEGPIDYSGQAGGRFTAAYWLDQRNTIGLEGSYFFLGTDTTRRLAGSPGFGGAPALSVPFVDANLNQENSTGIALPAVGGGFGGDAVVTVNTRLQGAEIDGVYNLVDRCGLRCDVLAGFRYLALDERLTFATRSFNVAPAPPDIFATRDRFRTENDFYAGQLGARAEYRHGSWYAQATGKLALGNVHQQTEITGLLTTNDFTNRTVVQPFAGGYFALPTNIGHCQRDRVGVVSELGTQVGWEPLAWIRVFMGYDFLYATHVARAGDQVDRVINPTQGTAFTNNPVSPLTGPARPVFLGRDTDFWAHGLNAGVELRF
jgi:Putative beta barrel porin-7 (BBP7)